MKDKLDRFLAENRPEPPAARTGEAQRIWNRLARKERPRFLAPRWLPVTGTIAALLLLWVTTHPTQMQRDAVDVEDFVVASMVDFYVDTEEMLFDF